MVAPFFIVGSGRSGTTLVRMMLMAGGQVAIPPESNFIPQLIERWPQYADDVDLIVSTLAPQYEQMEVHPAAVRSLLLDRPLSLESAITAPFEVYADGKRWGDKSPSYINSILAISAVFEEAKFVHIIRDGRDVALSYRDQPFGPKSFLANARRWELRVLHAAMAGCVLGPERYKEVRYEDLLAAPQAELRGLCAFLDLPYDPSMLDFPQLAHTLTDQEKAIHANLGKPLTKGLRDWRTVMTPKQVEMFDAMAGGALELFGYPRHRTDEVHLYLARFADTWLQFRDDVLKALASWQVSRSIAGRRSVPIEHIWRRVNE